jgi:hypothetical protein
VALVEQLDYNLSDSPDRSRTIDSASRAKPRASQARPLDDGEYSLDDFVTPQQNQRRSIVLDGAENMPRYAAVLESMSEEELARLTDEDLAKLGIEVRGGVDACGGGGDGGDWLCFLVGFPFLWVWVRMSRCATST